MSHVCNTCSDTHRFPYSGDNCTACPVPCQVCRMVIVNGEQFPGAYCNRTPCQCICHPFNQDKPPLEPPLEPQFLTDKEIIQGLISSANRLEELLGYKKSEPRRASHSEEWNEGYEECAREVLDTLDGILGVYLQI